MEGAAGWALGWRARAARRKTWLELTGRKGMAAERQPPGLGFLFGGGSITWRRAHDAPAASHTAAAAACAGRGRRGRRQAGQPHTMQAKGGLDRRLAQRGQRDSLAKSCMQAQPNRRLDWQHKRQQVVPFGPAPHKGPPRAPKLTSAPTHPPTNPPQAQKKRHYPSGPATPTPQNRVHT